MVVKRPAACVSSKTSSNLVDIITAAAAALSLNDLMRLACTSTTMARAAQVAVQKLPVRLSVVLPIYNAHSVGLSIAVRDVLKQTGQCCPPFEVLAVDDGSSDGGRVWLAALASALGLRGQVLWSDHGLNPAPQNRRSTSELTSTTSLAKDAEFVGTAAGTEVASSETQLPVVVVADDEHSLGGRVGAVNLPHASMRGSSTSPLTYNESTKDGAPAVLSPEVVAAAASASLVQLRVLSTVPGARGQGAAMDVGLQQARGEYIALMESDDTRPVHAFAALFAALLPQNNDHITHPVAAVTGNTTASLIASSRKSPLQRSPKLVEWRGHVDAVCSEVELVDDSIEFDSSPVLKGGNSNAKTSDSQLNDQNAIGSATDKSIETNASRQLQRARAIGAKWAGMHRYLGWQNALTTPAALAQNRFVEIPALHQTCLYPKALVMELGGYNAHSEWPVDMDFWMRFFAKGHTAGKVSAHEHIPLAAFPIMAANCSDHSSSQAMEPREAPAAAAAALATTAPTTNSTTGALYGWRMHAGQGTRNSGRCSTENLRWCKVYYMAQDPAGPAHGRHVQVISCGETLGAWMLALQATKCCASVTAVHWDTKQVPVLRVKDDHINYDDGNATAAVTSDTLNSEASAVEGAMVQEKSHGGKKGPSSSWPLPLHEAPSGQRYLRVFVYGMEKVRRRARATVGKQWDPDHDWFAA